MLALKSHDAETLLAKLAHDDIIISSRDGNMRVSPYFSNALEGIAALMSSSVKNESYPLRP